MKKYRLTGYFKMGTEFRQPFMKELAAESPAQAKERLFTLLGSKHSCVRRFIKIERIEEIKNA